MSCRPLPHYRPGHGWMLGVALPGTLTSMRQAFRELARVRCCSLPPAFSPHPLGEMQLSLARSCLQRTLQRTFTPNRSTMSNARAPPCCLHRASPQTEPQRSGILSAEN